MAIDNIRRYYSEMFSAERKVADYILEHASDVIDMSIAQLAQVSGTSDATIIRMCRHIGYSGFYQMKLNLASSVMKWQNEKKDEAAQKPEDVIGFFDAMAINVREIAKGISMETIMKCTDILQSTRRVYTIGFGNTETIAEDLAHRLARLGISSFTSPEMEYMTRCLSLAEKDEVLVAVSRSGASIYVIEALKMAKEQGMTTVLLTTTCNSASEKYSDYVLRCNVQKQMISILGAESNVYLLIMVDALLYFLKNNYELQDKAARSELLLSKYKM
jgi:DNA-binding MurR/RpiR family transcriptional regulator